MWLARGGASKRCAASLVPTERPPKVVSSRSSSPNRLASASQSPPTVKWMCAETQCTSVSYALARQEKCKTLTSSTPSARREWHTWSTRPQSSPSYKRSSTGCNSAGRAARFASKPTALTEHD